MQTILTTTHRRSIDLQNEIRELREQLGAARTSSAVANIPRHTSEQAITNWAMPTVISSYLYSPSTNPAQTDSSGVAFPPITGVTSVHTDVASVSGTELTEPHSRIPGLTTRPSIDEPSPRRSISQYTPRPRALGNIALSVEEIDELFNMWASISVPLHPLAGTHSTQLTTFPVRRYLRHYHPFIPLIDTSISPQACYECSEILFWSIISVASRRMGSRPTLLPKLARSVTDLLWKTLRSIPYSLAAVQSMVLLCTWPFPTSSSTADPTFMLAGTMLQIATQMGLHRALDAQDFAKVPKRLGISEYTEWMRTWEACNVVAQR